MSVWIQEATEHRQVMTWATWPPLHHGDLEEVRPHKMISSDKEKTIDVEASNSTEIQI